MKIEVASLYHMRVTHRLDLPDKKTWDDVKEWMVKWNVLHIEFKDGTEWEKPLDARLVDGELIGMAPGKSNSHDEEANGVEVGGMEEWCKWPKAVDIKEVIIDEDGEVDRDAMSEAKPLETCER
jgi:hypothetical protein